MPTEENTPLLAPNTGVMSGDAGTIGETFDNSQIGAAGDAPSAGSVVINSVDEVPPPSYTTVTGGPPMVACRVCQGMVDISGKREQHVVKCPNCSEATPIRNAPPGRKYVRCPCNCLLICKNTSQRIACPRHNCKRVISLAPSLPPVSNVPTVPGMCRVTCVHCRDSFLFNATSNKLARCPHCRRISAVGGDYGQKRGILLLVLSVMTFAVAIAITVGTYTSAVKEGGLYLLYIVLFVCALLLCLRGFYYYTMKISHVEGPV